MPVILEKSEKCCNTWTKIGFIFFLTKTKCAEAEKGIPLRLLFRTMLSLDHASHVFRLDYFLDPFC